VTFNKLSHERFYVAELGDGKEAKLSDQEVKTYCYDDDEDQPAQGAVRTKECDGHCPVAKLVHAVVLRLHTKRKITRREVATHFLCADKRRVMAELRKIHYRLAKCGRTELLPSHKTLQADFRAGLNFIATAAFMPLEWIDEPHVRGC
jgi:hypothetical protein